MYNLRVFILPLVSVQAIHHLEPPSFSLSEKSFYLFLNLMSSQPFPSFTSFVKMIFMFCENAGFCNNYFSVYHHGQYYIFFLILIPQGVEIK